MDTQHVLSFSDYPAGWQEPAEFILDESGNIRDCNKTSEELFGYTLRELISQHISKLLPQLSKFEVIHDGQFNRRLAYLCHCGYLFIAQNHYGVTFSSELRLVNLSHAGMQVLKLLVLPGAD